MSEKSFKTITQELSKGLAQFRGQDATAAKGGVTDDAYVHVGRAFVA